MERAVVLIGVQQAAALTPLKAVLDGISAMKEWATAQEIATVEVITDEDGKVTVADITTAIGNILRAGPPDQLIVYFAGHGINKVYSEYWLLSDAPEWAGEAVNVTASAELARRCGVNHVVFISDACRTAPDGIGAQAVTGAPIFPNISGARPGSVDMFFANRVGEPAFEIADASAATGRFTSAFTDVLTRSLNGMYTELLEDRDDDPGKMVLRPWPLNRALPDLLLDELERLGVDLTINQQPDALISSDPTQAWLSVVSAKRSFSLKPKIPTPRTLAERIAAKLSGALPGNDNPMIDLTDSNDDVSAPTGGSPSRADGIEDRLPAATAEIANVDWSAVDPVAPGVRVHGATVTRYVQGSMATFVEFDGGRCTNLARFDGNDCCAVVIDGELVSVHWQPSPAAEDAGVTQSRAALAAASRSGVLRFEPGQVEEMRAQAGQSDAAVDVYLAYATRPSAIDDSACFDLGLLADHATIVDASGDLRWPGFPLLSRGFGLLQALPPEDLTAAQLAQALSAHAVPSHWSLFTLDAEPLLAQLLEPTTAPAH